MKAREKFRGHEKKKEEEGRKMAIRQFLLFSGAIFSRVHPALLNLEPSSQVKNSPLIIFLFCTCRWENDALATPHWEFKARVWLRKKGKFVESGP